MKQYKVRMIIQTEQSFIGAANRNDRKILSSKDYKKNYGVITHLKFSVVIRTQYMFSICLLPVANACLSRLQKMWDYVYFFLPAVNAWLKQQLNNKLLTPEICHHLRN